MHLIDELELLTVEHQKTAFPAHYHEGFCISLIRNGMECIALDQHHLLSESGTITITNPYEVHANPIIDKDVYLSFDTFYCSQGLMKHLLGGKNIIFNNRKISHPQANKLFLEVKHLKQNALKKEADALIYKFAETLALNADDREEEYGGIDFKELEIVNDYIQENIYNPFNLEQLAKLSNQNKFGFAKKFKANTGMSPMNYILMKKIFSSKEKIAKETSLTHLAYDYHFSDLAHYSKTFKRFVGIAPKSYQDELMQK